MQIAALRRLNAMEYTVVDDTVLLLDSQAVRNKCHENFTDIRVSCESRGGRDLFLLQKSWESLGKREPWRL